MARRGVACAPSEMLVTTGSQQGLDLLLRVLVNPGDVALTEQPAYPQRCRRSGFSRQKW
ncbi:MAG: Aromatic-amino-acid aminotransferase (EC [uncultured Paraburkholderia sp.]|nr:MAG: Aromatic-amino-acid aminotransferase (EC [uncultured Paraburkholderia sp.]